MERIVSIPLANHAVQLVIDPDRGGGMLSFKVHDRPIFRTAVQCGGPLALANFPLVPFANRISAKGRWCALSPNAPDVDPVNAIHGFGWLNRWQTRSQSRDHVELAHHHSADEWPWAYEAVQRITLRERGYVHELGVTNLADTPMPAGLGIHPYFPRTGARLDLQVSGRWQVDRAGLPSEWLPLSEQPAWFGGGSIDHCFTGRAGAITVTWPDHRLRIAPDDALVYTHVYVPEGADHFCVEPVTHMPDAINRDDGPASTGLKWLAPHEVWRCSVEFEVELDR